MFYLCSYFYISCSFLHILTSDHGIYLPSFFLSFLSFSPPTAFFLFFFSSSYISPSITSPPLPCSRECEQVRETGPHSSQSGGVRCVCDSDIDSDSNGDTDSDVDSDVDSDAEK